MTDQPVCQVCGLPVEQHAVVLRDGVAHTVVPGKGSCSGVAGDREYMRGRLSQMDTIIRSLRYMAGRERNLRARSMALRDYSDIVAKQRDKLVRDAQKWFSWGSL